MENAFSITIVTGNAEDCSWFADNCDNTDHYKPFDLRRKCKKDPSRSGVDRNTDYSSEKVQVLCFEQSGFLDIVEECVEYSLDEAQAGYGAGLLLNCNAGVHRCTTAAKAIQSCANSMLNDDGGRLFNCNVFMLHKCSRWGDYHDLVNNANTWVKEPWTLIKGPTRLDEMFGHCVSTMSPAAAENFGKMMAMARDCAPLSVDSGSRRPAGGSRDVVDNRGPRPPSFPPPSARSEPEEFEYVKVEVEDDGSPPAWAMTDNRHFPTCWHSFLNERGVDTIAQQALFALADKGEAGKIAAGDIIWKIIKKEHAQERINNYSGFVMKTANRAHCDISGWNPSESSWEEPNAKRRR